MQTISCPKCNEEFEVAAKATVPPTQKFAVTLTHESQMISAITVGKTIVNTVKMMEEGAKTAGATVHVFLSGIKEEPGTLRLEFSITKLG